MGVIPASTLAKITKQSMFGSRAEKKSFDRFERALVARPDLP
jgi:hypothetical protein